ncbi:hypothetical protein E2320_018832, partial [Naja naja]
MLRNQINRVYLLYRNRGDKCPPEDYYRLKREYKGLIAKEKRAKERQKWDLLLFSIQQKNTRLFWQIVASSLPGQELPLCCISNRHWKNHFLSIFQASTSSTELGPQLPAAIPDWQPVTHAEITELISELKTPALGLDIESSHQQILKFFYTQGGQFIPSALRIYKAKTLAQTLYRIPIWIRGFKDCIERIQAVFLRKLLGLPPAPMYLDLGTRSVKCMMWVNTFKWWFQ